MRREGKTDRLNGRVVGGRRGIGEVAQRGVVRLATPPGAVRMTAGRALGVAGLSAYNWWLVAPLLPGASRSFGSFFSDLAADGQPHAEVLQRLDLLAGTLVLAGLVLRGPVGRHGPRREWPWLVAFAASAGLGGAFPYACASSLDATCRTLERHVDLPAHHYVHMFAGVSEFVVATAAIVFAHLSTLESADREARVAKRLVWVMVVGHPVLVLAYLTRRWGVLIEPVFFVAFSAMVVVELFTPPGADATTPSSAPRRAAARRSAY